jgi:hypothetical protein
MRHAPRPSRLAHALASATALLCAHAHAQDGYDEFDDPNQAISMTALTFNGAGSWTYDGSDLGFEANHLRVLSQGGGVPVLLGAYTRGGAILLKWPYLSAGAQFSVGLLGLQVGPKFTFTQDVLALDARVGLMDIGIVPLGDFGPYIKLTPYLGAEFGKKTELSAGAMLGVMITDWNGGAGEQ